MGEFVPELSNDGVLPLFLWLLVKNEFVVLVEIEDFLLLLNLFLPSLSSSDSLDESEDDPEPEALSSPEGPSTLIRIASWFDSPPCLFTAPDDIPIRWDVVDILGRFLPPSNPFLFLTLLFGGLPRSIRQSSQSQTFGRFSGGGSRQV